MLFIFSAVWFSGNEINQCVLQTRCLFYESHSVFPFAIIIVVLSVNLMELCEGNTKLLGSFEKLRKAATALSWPLVCASVRSRFPQDGFSWNLTAEKFSIQVWLITDSFDADQSTAVIISRSVPLRIGNVFENLSRKWKHTFNVEQLFPESCVT
jgi:hypothetical protein